jgi:DNA-binding NarL/FixJ family response regulator
MTAERRAYLGTATEPEREREHLTRVLVLGDGPSRARIARCLQGHAHVIARSTARRALETLRLRTVDALVVSIGSHSGRSLHLLTHLPPGYRPTHIVVLADADHQEFHSTRINSVLPRQCSPTALLEAVLSQSQPPSSAG